MTKIVIYYRSGLSIDNIEQSLLQTAEELIVDGTPITDGNCDFVPLLTQLTNIKALAIKLINEEVLNVLHETLRSNQIETIKLIVLQIPREMFLRKDQRFNSTMSMPGKC